VPGPIVDEISALARLANTEFQSDRSMVRRGLHHKQQELAILERTTTQFRYFLPVMLTGLLQTPDYLRAALSNLPGDHSLQIDLKLERQAILSDLSRSFTFLLTEAAVRFRPDPAALMVEQIDRLLQLSKSPNLRLGVIPEGRVVPRGPMNTFTVYDDRLVTAELFNGVIVMRDPRDIAFHRDLFSFFEQYASFGEDARHRLLRLRARMGPKLAGRRIISG
jgi:hypothetical protein